MQGPSRGPVSAGATAATRPAGSSARVALERAGLFEAPGVGPCVASVPVCRGGLLERTEDIVAVEEPLEIRLAGETVVVVMRTPGDDHRLAIGYLFAEGIISGSDDASDVFHCGWPGDFGYGNVVEVTPASRDRIDWTRLRASRRGGVTSSAGGVCRGASSVADLLARVAPLPLGQPVAKATVTQAVAALADYQPTWHATGGTHAAVLFARDGTLVVAHEDVGRHNAVDKVVGGLLLARAAGAAPEPAVLAVSGRGGFEIVQKAARAGIPVVACVSAATTMAIRVARAAGVTLCGFVRGDRLTVYAGAERILSGGYVGTIQQLPVAVSDGAGR